MLWAFFRITVRRARVVERVAWFWRLGFGVEEGI
jgi:hypothetical protein